MNTVTLSGAGTFILEGDDDFDSLETLAATDYTGDLEADLSAADSDDLDVQTGEGDDEVAIFGTQFAAAKTDVVVDLGEGDNALVVTGLANQGDFDDLDFTAGTVAGVDTLGILADISLTGDGELDLDGISPSNIVFAEGDELDVDEDTLTFKNEATDLAITFEDEVTTKDDAEFTFNDVEDLTLNIEDSLGGGDGANITANELTDLTVNVEDEDASFDEINVANGAAADSDILTLTTSGAGDIEGTLDIDGTALNGIELTNSGEGDRTFTLNGAADLKEEAGDGQAAGEGVVIDGDGTGDVTFAADGDKLDEMSVDASEYTGGDVILSVTSNDAVDAENFTGIDVLDIDAALVDKEVSNLAAGVVVQSSNAATDVTMDDEVTERTFVLAADAADYVDATVETLTIETSGGNRTLTSLDDDTGVDTALNTLNINADAGNFTLTNEYVLRNGTSEFGRDFDLTLDGEDDITFTGGLGTGDGIDNFTINTNGTGDHTLGTITLGDGAAETMTADGTFTLAGSNGIDGTDSTLAEIDIGDDQLDGATISLENDEGVTIDDLDGQLAADAELIINSAGGDANELSDASNITTQDGSTLTITGDQDFTLGADATADSLELGAANGDEATLDASAYTGELTAFIARVDDGAGSDNQTVKVGTGDATIKIDGVADDNNDDDFTFEFNDEGIGDVEIKNFSDEDANVQDVLDFSEFGWDEFGTGDLNDELHKLTGDGDTASYEELDFEQDGTDLLITSDEFDGTIQLTGVTGEDLDAADNFEDWAA